MFASALCDLACQHPPQDLVFRVHVGRVTGFCRPTSLSRLSCSTRFVVPLFFVCTCFSSRFTAHAPPSPTRCLFHSQPIHSLHASNHFVLTGSLLDLVTKTEVIVRGLYHAAAADLEITLLHQEHSCVLSAATSFSAETRPAGVQFGVPEERRYMRGFGPNPGTLGCVGGWAAWVAYASRYNVVWRKIERTG